LIPKGLEFRSQIVTEPAQYGEGVDWFPRRGD
jgi:hypothetical protein